MVNFFGRSGRFFEYYDYKMQDADNQRITHNADMYIQELSVVDIGLRHTKQSTSGNFFAQVGVISGLIHLLYFVTLMVMRPISRHSFIMRALKRFYMARTTSADVFKKY